MNYKRIAGQLRYKIFSRHKKGYGIHSPFVYELVREVFNGPLPPGLWRQASQYANYDFPGRKYGRLLYNMAVRYDGNNIYTAGRPCEACDYFLKAGAPSSQFWHIGTAGDLIPSFGAHEYAGAMAFISGLREGERLKYYFGLITEHIAGLDVLIIDNINANLSMKNAWDEIKSSHSVSVSIDIYRMGLLFFRAGIIKQHYIIRY